MHIKGAKKRQEKQAHAPPQPAYPDTFHRSSTGLSTNAPADERLRPRCRFATRPALARRSISAQ
jgi:hypothetical protein